MKKYAGWGRKNKALTIFVKVRDFKKAIEVFGADLRAPYKEKDFWATLLDGTEINVRAIKQK